MYEGTKGRHARVFRVCNFGVFVYKIAIWRDELREAGWMRERERGLMGKVSVMCFIDHVLVWRCGEFLAVLFIIFRYLGKG